MKQKVNVVILAAGKGTRMYSDLPKVLHKLAGKPMLQHVVSSAASLDPTRIELVVGHGADLVKKSMQDHDLGYVLQEEQKGTAHAVHQALHKLDDDALALILFGDVPLIKPETLECLLDELQADNMGVLTCMVNNPASLGRILRDEKGNIQAIVEEKDASKEQREIREINTGIMAIPVSKLQQWLPKIQSNNAQGEYYLTDIVALALADGCEVKTVSCKNEMEVCGVNNKLQLALLERHYQREQADALMLSGVGLADPARVDIRGYIETGKDVYIDINFISEGRVKIGNNVKIGANVILKDVEVGDGTEILANSIIEESSIGRECNIGPFARIRPGTNLEEKVKIGNFVETKKAFIREGSKVNHLSYIGDSNLGTQVNVGAGTITCNYDGANKFVTEIGDNVFIGSNAALVAPVTIHKGATVGAGSVITGDVQENQLAVSRPKQRNIDGWQRPVKKPVNPN